MPYVPDMRITLLVMLPVCLGLWRKGIVGRFMAWSAIGFLWAVFTAGTLVGQINRLSQGPVMNAVVQVSSITLSAEERKRTVMHIEQIDGRWLVPSIAFSTLWQPKDRPLCAGQRWRLQLRLRPMHGNLNEGALTASAGR